MARREVYDCDKCKATDIDPHRVSVVVGTYHDPCDGTQKDDRMLELCGKCCAILLRNFLSELPTFEAGRAWYFSATGRKP